MIREIAYAYGCAATAIAAFIAVAGFAVKLIDPDEPDAFGIAVFSTVLAVLIGTLTYYTGTGIQ